ncbi:uncharacterized protein [Haliotis cracherodii]|uniref:uncharacterized protein n=1 Tax=Haliotis cracherodii TaxID=6455 RepID=UPI0039EAE0E1
MEFGHRESDEALLQKPPAMTFKFAPTRLSRPNFLPPIVCSRRLYIQITLAIMLVAIVVIVRALSNMRVVFVQFHNESDTDGELVILPEDYSAPRGAYCLDGSPPAFYLRHGEISAENNWLLHLQSGGWCVSPTDCYHRSFTELGSSQSAHTSALFEGILSSDERVNPDFFTWNTAQFLYCDGSSFTGNKSGVLDVQSRQLYLRGGAVFETLIEYLLSHTSLATAHHVILAGSSAGGLAALLQADRLREKLPSSVKTLHVLVDGSLFLDQPDANQQHVMAEMLHNTYNLHNLRESLVLKECTGNLPEQVRWRCFLPEVFYKHVFTPMFFANSLYDTWYSSATLSISCTRAGLCPPRNMQVLDRVKQAILQHSQDLLASGKNGVFLTSCPAHTLLANPRFNSMKAGQLTSQDAISMWLKHNKKGYNVSESIDLNDSAHYCKLFY